MQIAYLTLISLQMIGTLTAPFYLRIRGRMSDHKVKYSKRKIYKDICLHFLMMSFITGHFIIILYSILNSQTETSSQLLFYSSLQLIFLGAALYGSGMYIVAILFESVVRKQYPIIKLIHGPISHSIMYGAYLCSFGNLANLARFAPQYYFFPPLLFIIIGILGGYSAAVSAISSGISYQYTLIAILTGLLFLVGQQTSNAFVVHFFSFIFTTIIAGVIYWRWSLRRYKKVIWYKPINITKVKF